MLRAWPIRFYGPASAPVVRIGPFCCCFCVCVCVCVCVRERAHLHARERSVKLVIPFPISGIFYFADERVFLNPSSTDESLRRKHVPKARLVYPSRAWGTSVVSWTPGGQLTCSNANDGTHARFTRWVANERCRQSILVLALETD